VSAVVHIPGLSGLPLLVGSPLELAASHVGRVSLPVPAAVRHRIRHYLLHHRGVKGEVHLTVTDVGGTGSAAAETLNETLPIWTLPGLR
jgi:hypothetical protein